MNKPNQTTIETFAKTDANIDVIECSGTKDMFQKLEPYSPRLPRTPEECAILCGVLDPYAECLAKDPDGRVYCFEDLDVVFSDIWGWCEGGEWKEIPWAEAAFKDIPAEESLTMIVR